jgi:DNA-binding beta-propeller fold protein YncE
MRVQVGLFALVGALSVCFTPSAVAAVGDLTFRGCLANDTNEACTDIANAPLGGANGVAVSPDGSSVYVTSVDSDSITTFRRAPNGALTFAGCLADDAAQGCTDLPLSPLNGANGVAVSPDGDSVYVTGVFANSVVHFVRAPDGALTFAGCVANDATQGCTNNGDGAPLTTAQGIAVRPNGDSVYVTGAGTSTSSSLSHLVAAPTGQLAFAGCISATMTSVATGCTPTSTNQLREAADVAVRPDGDTVYAVAGQAGQLLRFGVGAGGQLTFFDCFGEPMLGCVDLPGSPMGRAWGVAISPDGSSAYVAARSSSSVSEFGLDGDGDLSFNGCLADAATATTAGCTRLSSSPLGDARDVVVSPDGASAYVAGGSLATFGRGTDGRLSFAGCHASNESQGCTNLPEAPLDGANGVAVSPDGASVYAVSSASDSIVEFARETPPLTLDLTGKKKQRVKRLAANATCSDPCSVELRAKGRAGKKFSSKLAQDDLAEGETAKIRVKLKRKTLRKVDDEKGKATITGTATDDRGRTVTDKLKLKLRP